MKKILMLIKISFPVVSFFVMTVNFQVLAIDEFETENGCNTSSSCSYFPGRGCWCSDLNNCNGCYLDSGDGGLGNCGTCYKR